MAPRNSTLTKMRTDYMGSMWERIHLLHVHGHGLRVEEGPSLHELEHCLCVPDLAYQQPVEFVIPRGVAASIVLKVRIRMASRSEADGGTLWQLLAILESRFDAPPYERPTLEDATLFFGNYSTRTRKGAVQVPHSWVQYI